MSAARTAPHRVSLHPAPVPRMKVVDALAAVKQRIGLDEVKASDLETWRMLMSPAEFKRFCNRLDKAISAHRDTIARAAWADSELPFGTDVQDVWRRERLGALVDRPSGEPYPVSWTIESECRLPGRLLLVPGREFSVRGLRGRLRFRHLVTTDCGECWLDGWDTDGGSRSVRPDWVRMVHSKSKARPT